MLCKIDTFGKTFKAYFKFTFCFNTITLSEIVKNNYLNRNRLPKLLTGYILCRVLTIVHSASTFSCKQDLRLLIRKSIVDPHIFVLFCLLALSIYDFIVMLNGYFTLQKRA